MMTHTKNAKCEFDCFIRRFLITTNYRAQMYPSCCDFQISRDLRGWWESKCKQLISNICFHNIFFWISSWLLTYLDDNLILLDIGNEDRLTFQRYFFTRNQTVLGKIRQFFLLAQSFYQPQTKRSHNGQFSPKSPNLPQNQVKV